MRTFMTNLMRQQRGELVEEPVRSEPFPVTVYSIEDSEGHSNVTLSNVQVTMAPQVPTNVSHPTALSRKEVVVRPKGL